MDARQRVEWTRIRALFDELAAAMANPGEFDRYTDVLVMRYVDGWTWDRIGQLMGVSRTRPGQIRNKALRYLRAESGWAKREGRIQPICRSLADIPRLRADVFGEHEEWFCQEDKP